MPGPVTEAFIKDGKVAHHENTMRTSSLRSGQVSLQRLEYRYHNADLKAAAHSLCNYLRLRGDRNNLFDRYRCAERALYPDFGAVGLRDEALKAVLYYWVAANDNKKTISSSIADRRECIVRALYESQRGNNMYDPNGCGNSAAINFIDDFNECDNTICLKGVINKFAEVLYAMHPDVVLVEDLNVAIYDLIRGLIAKYLYAAGRNYNNLIDPNLNLSDKNILPATQIEKIKSSVIEIFGIAEDSEYIGLLTETEIRYINEMFNDDALQNLTFVKSSMPPVSLSEDCIAALIRDADFRMQEVSQRQMSKSPASTTRATDAKFDAAEIKKTLKSVLPIPSNKARVHGISNMEIRECHKIHTGLESAGQLRYVN